MGRLVVWVSVSIYTNLIASPFPPPLPLFTPKHHFKHVKFTSSENSRFPYHLSYTVIVVVVVSLTHVLLLLLLLNMISAVMLGPFVIMNIFGGGLAAAAAEEGEGEGEEGGGGSRMS